MKRDPSKFNLPNNRPLAKMEAEEIRDAALVIGRYLERWAGEGMMGSVDARKALRALERATRMAYDAIPLVEEKGYGA